MKYKIISEEKLPHPDWKVGDIVGLNELSAEYLKDSIEPYEGEAPNKHTWVALTPINIKMVINDPQ